jgi:hypothetical protein
VLEADDKVVGTAHDDCPSREGDQSFPREGTSWQHILQTLVCYRLIDAGSEWRLHRQCFEPCARAWTTLFTGRLFDDRGNGMTPSHTRKRPTDIVVAEPWEGSRQRSASAGARELKGWSSTQFGLAREGGGERQKSIET